MTAWQKFCVLPPTLFPQILCRLLQSGDLLSVLLQWPVISVSLLTMISGWCNKWITSVVLQLLSSTELDKYEIPGHEADWKTYPRLCNVAPWLLQLSFVWLTPVFDWHAPACAEFCSQANRNEMRSRQCHIDFTGCQSTSANHLQVRPSFGPLLPDWTFEEVCSFSDS